MFCTLQVLGTQGMDNKKNCMLCILPLSGPSHGCLLLSVQMPCKLSPGRAGRAQMKKKISPSIPSATWKALYYSFLSMDDLRSLFQPYWNYDSGPTIEPSPPCLLTTSPWVVCVGEWVWNWHHWRINEGSQCSTINHVCLHTVRLQQSQM